MNNRGRSSRLSDNLRGYSLVGKTAILHIVILGSIPNISKKYLGLSIAQVAQLVERIIEADYVGGSSPSLGN
jgi:hypothetical protein